MSTGTVRLHRVLRAPPERVYRAFLDADAMARWLPLRGFTCKVHGLDARVGGGYRVAFTNISNGQGHSFAGEYLELVPPGKIICIDRFDDPGMPGELRTTITLDAVLTGTGLQLVQEGLPEAFPVDMCCLGWQERLDLLASLVEPGTPG